MYRFDEGKADIGAGETSAGIYAEIAYERGLTAVRRWVESMEGTLNRPRVTWPSDVRDASPRR